MLDADEVAAAAADWVWVPQDATVVEGADFELIAYPEHFADPTVCLRIDSARPAAIVVDEVLAVARRLGRSAVTFAGLSERTRPGGLEPELRRRGAQVVETLGVLALDLNAPAPALPVPPEVSVSPVRDLDTLAALDRVNATVFGGRPRSRGELAAELPAVAGERPPRLAASLDGVVVGGAGATWADPVLRLWGAGVLPEARGRGVYRALLARRLEIGRGLGARWALVKGRVETSGPILARAGFAAYGEERNLRLATGV